MATATPLPKSDDLFSLTLRQAKAWGAALTSYLGGIAALITGYVALKNYFPEWNHALVVGMAGVPLALALLTVTLPAWVKRRRDRKLMEEGIAGTLSDPGYFRLRPYEAGDRERYWRPDGAHEEILRWIQTARDPVLYLTGRSGTGKSSLLNAWVLPRLREEGPACRVLVVRSYRDPLEALVAQLRAPGVIWQKPASDLPTDPRSLLERAVDYLQPKRRLLIVFDQFEEFVILHDIERRQHLEGFLHRFLEQPVPGAAVLLVLRSDYLGVLDQLDLPLLRQRDNWREVGPFLQSAAAAFLDRSGLQLGPELKEKILNEAAEIEENPGLIRPITLNMFGLVLSRFTGKLPPGFEAGRLITAYLRDTLNHPEIRAHAPKIIQNMLVPETGTKRPCSEAELGRATQLDPGLVRGCLLALGNRGLVRSIDEVGHVWEISHDFVARLLNQIVGKWRRPWWRTLLPWIAPASLLLWIGIVFVGSPIYRASAAIDLLEQRNINVQVLGNEFWVEFPGDAAADRWQEQFEGALTELEKLQFLWMRVGGLRLDGLPIVDLRPLEGLSGLQRLDLNATRVTELDPVQNLPGLKSLLLAQTPVADLRPLEGLPELEVLGLGGTQVTDIDPLDGLPKLKMLDLAGTRVSRLSPVQGLTGLEMLNLAWTPVTDLDPLQGLRELKMLDLTGTRVTELAPLHDLAALQTLLLTHTPVTDIGPLRGLSELRVLDLSGTRVTELGLLEHLAELRTLLLTHTPVTDVSPLQGLSELRMLSLSGTQVTDLGPIEGLLRLRILDLKESRVQDLGPVQSLRELQAIDLTATEVTDLGPLHDLPQLQNVNLKQTNVDENQIRALKTAFAEKGRDLNVAY